MPKRKYKPGPEGYTFTMDSLSYAKHYDVFCGFCNRRFTPSQKRGPRPTYCCTACKQAAYRDRKQAAYRDRKLAHSGRAVKPVTSVAEVNGLAGKGAE